MPLNMLSHTNCSILSELLMDIQLLNLLWKGWNCFHCQGRNYIPLLNHRNPKCMCIHQIAFQQMHTDYLMLVFCKKNKLLQLFLNTQWLAQLQIRTVMVNLLFPICQRKEHVDWPVFFKFLVFVERRSVLTIPQ